MLLYRKFQPNSPCGLRDVKKKKKKKKRFSRWWPWRPSCILDQHNLANFDPEVVLQSKFQLISTKGLGTVVENGFQDGGCGDHLGFSIGPVLAIMCLQGAPMLLIKFQFNWIIVFRGEAQIMNSQHFFPI